MIYSQGFWGKKMATIEEINALYQSVFNRPADTAGAEYWARTGATPAEIRQALASSPEAIVRNTYQEVFNRPGDTVGVEYWTPLLASGQISRENLAAAFKATTEGQGLLGGGATTGGATTGTTTGAATGGILGGTQAAANKGMPYDDAVSRITSFYRSMFDRAPDAAGLKYWADLLTSGNQTWDEVSANIRRSAEAQTSQSKNAQAGIRQVPFGSQPVGGILYQTTQMPSAASIPSFQQFADPNAVANSFQQSLAYQAALPSMIPQFNPADIPATYQQIANPRQRLDIANVQIPDWLRIAAAKDEARADAETAALSGGATGATGTTGNTSGITSTTPGTIGTTGGGGGTTVGGGGTTGLRSAADMQAFGKVLADSYQMAFNRAPETAGAQYWTNLYSSGTPFPEIVNAIMNSPEAQARSATSGGLLGGISE